MTRAWRDGSRRKTRPPRAGPVLAGVRPLPRGPMVRPGPARALRAVGDRAGAAAVLTADGRGDRIVDQVMAKGDAVGNAEWIFGCSAGRSYKPSATRAISWFPDSQRL